MQSVHDHGNDELLIEVCRVGDVAEVGDRARIHPPYVAGVDELEDEQHDQHGVDGEADDVAIGAALPEAYGEKKSPDGEREKAAAGELGDQAAREAEVQKQREEAADEDSVDARFERGVDVGIADTVNVE
jgi:hypothetical protein